MTGREEHAEGTRGFGSFPASWGFPAGHAMSEERAAWVKENVQRHIVAEPLRQLEARRQRMLADLRLAYINRKKDGP